MTEAADLDKITERVQKILALGRRGGTEAEAAAAVAAAVAASLDAEAAQREVLIEVAEQLRAKRPWTPVVIITGYGSADHEARAAAAGVQGFLRKPLSPEMIERSVDAAIATTMPLPAEMLPQVASVAAPEQESTGSARKVELILAGGVITSLK